MIHITNIKLPVISIIIPVFNGSSYIIRAIDSVLKQNLENIEIIIIDDCSTDETAKIISCIADSRVRTIQNRNNIGVAGSRNIALNNARGSWIQFLDADDYILPEKFLIQLKDSDKFDLIYSDWYCENDQESYLELCHPKLQVNQPHLPQLALSNPFPIHAPIFRRTLMNNKLLFNEILEHEDWKFWFDLFSLEVRAKYIQQPLCTYFKHKNSRNFDLKRSLLGDLEFLEGVPETINGYYLKHIINDTVREKCAQLTSVCLIRDELMDAVFWKKKAEPLKLAETIDILIAKNHFLHPIYRKVFGPRKLIRFLKHRKKTLN